MNKRPVALLVSGALVAGLTLGGLGIASAATRSTHRPTVAAQARTLMHGVSPVVTLSRMTGLSVKQINTLHHQGQSFSSISTSMGLDPAAVVDRMLASRKAHLDTLVATQHMTAAREQTMLTTMHAVAERMMGVAPGIVRDPSHDTTASMPATGMPGYGNDGANAGTGSGMMTPPTAPADPGTPADPTAPATPSGPRTGMMGSGSGSGSGMGMGR